MPSSGLTQVDWEYWSKRISCSLREAVALSLGLKPESLGDSAWEGRTYPGDPYKQLLQELKDRLEIAEDHANARELPLRERFPNLHRSTVDLGEFRSWAESLALSLPEEFPRSRESELPQPGSETAPQESVIDPLQLPNWPLWLALLWIRARSPDVLTEYVNRSNPGGTRLDVEMASAFALRADGVAVLSQNEATEQLRAKLEAVELVMCGLRNGQGMLEDVPAREFATRCFAFEDTGGLEGWIVAPGMKEDLARPDLYSKRTYWTEPQLRSQEVLRIWPINARVGSREGAALGRQKLVSAPAHRPPEARKNAEAAITAIWPDGLPDGMKRSARTASVNEWLTKNGLPTVSDDTVDRALGKRQ